MRRISALPLLALAFLLAAGTLQAQEPDCRVARMVIRWKRLPLDCAPTTKLLFRVVYFGVDGKRLPRTCVVDGPTWGYGPVQWPYELHYSGHYLWLKDVFPGDKVYVEATSWDHHGEPLRWERTVTVPE